MHCVHNCSDILGQITLICHYMYMQAKAYFSSLVLYTYVPGYWYDSLSAVSSSHCCTKKDKMGTIF